MKFAHTSLAIFLGMLLKTFCSLCLLRAYCRLQLLLQLHVFLLLSMLLLTSMVWRVVHLLVLMPALVRLQLILSLLSLYCSCCSCCFRGGSGSMLAVGSQIISTCLLLLEGITGHVCLSSLPD